MDYIKGSLNQKVADAKVKEVTPKRLFYLDILKVVYGLSEK